MSLSVRSKLAYCAGCHDNVYNHGCGGSSQCWSLKSAKLVMRREVDMNQRPPWTGKPRKMLDCYHQPGYAYVKPEVTC